MADVNVSQEALARVRNSLKVFNRDIEGLSATANQRSETCKMKCKKIISSTEDEVQSLNYEIEELTEELKKLLVNINDLTNSIDNIEHKLTVLNNRASELSDRIASLYSIQASLQSGSNAEAGDGQNRIASEMSRFEREKDEIIKEIKFLNSKKHELEQQLSVTETQRMKRENELNVQKKRRAKFQDKLERLNRAFNSACSDLDAYIDATKKFEGYAKTKISADQNAISICILAIDNYLATSLESMHHATTSGSNSIEPTNNGDESARNAVALYELSVLRGDLELSNGDPATPQLGGFHRNVRGRIEGFESHHIPSVAAQGINADNLPTIAISRDDHSLTNSFRGRQSRRHQSFLPDVERSDTYRNESSEMIQAGNYMHLVRYELYNIIDACGHRYDGAINQYLDALEEYIRTNGIPGAR